MHKFTEIQDNTLKFHFNNDTLTVSFNKTYRLDQQDRVHQLPPMLGKFPLYHVSDYPALPAEWQKHKGIFLPIYDKDAMFIGFHSHSGRPYAVKIASGKINAVSGKPWTNTLQTAENGVLDYLSIPEQLWLDGWNSGKDKVKQFVATTLGEGKTVEAQLTSQEEVGGIQIIVYPLKESIWQTIKKPNRLIRSTTQILPEQAWACTNKGNSMSVAGQSIGSQMGIGAGQEIIQQIYQGKYNISDFDTENSQRIFVHMLNADLFSMITHQAKPGRVNNDRPEYWGIYHKHMNTSNPSKELSKIKSIQTLETDGEW